jgi:hypothetical protein
LQLFVENLGNTNCILHWFPIYLLKKLFITYPKKKKVDPRFSLRRRLGKKNFALAFLSQSGGYFWDFIKVRISSPDLKCS